MYIIASLKHARFTFDNQITIDILRLVATHNLIATV